MNIYMKMQITDRHADKQTEMHTYKHKHTQVKMKFRKIVMKCEMIDDKNMGVYRTRE